MGVLGLGPIGVSITDSEAGDNYLRTDDNFDLAGATVTGFGSSATNWEITANTYQAGVNCVATVDDAYEPND